jgi:hypothetical protein
VPATAVKRVQCTIEQADVRQLNCRPCWSFERGRCAKASRTVYHWGKAAADESRRSAAHLSFWLTAVGVGAIRFRDTRSATEDWQFGNEAKSESGGNQYIDLPHRGQAGLNQVRAISILLIRLAKPNAQVPPGCARHRNMLESLQVWKLQVSRNVYATPLRLINQPLLHLLNGSTNLIDVRHERCKLR